MKDLFVAINAGVHKTGDDLGEATWSNINLGFYTTGE